MSEMAVLIKILLKFIYTDNPHKFEKVVFLELFHHNCYFHSFPTGAKSFSHGNCVKIGARENENKASFSVMILLSFGGVNIS